jgi:hypothetical protein
MDGLANQYMQQQAAVAPSRWCWSYAEGSEGAMAAGPNRMEQNMLYLLIFEVML